MVVDDQSEISFPIPQLKGRCHGNQFFLVLSTELSSGEALQTALACSKMQTNQLTDQLTVSGAAGPATIGLLVQNSTNV